MRVSVLVFGRRVWGAGGGNGAGEMVMMEAAGASVGGLGNKAV